MRLLPAFLAAAGFVSTAGCVGHATAPPDLGALRYRASLDLRCSAIRTSPAGPRTQLVRGCNQEAIYVQQCQVGSNKYGSWDTNCTWLLDRGPSLLVSTTR